MLCLNCFNGQLLHTTNYYLFLIVNTDESSLFFLLELSFIIFAP